MRTLRHLRSFTTYAALLGLLCPTLLAQDPIPPSQAQQRELTFKVTSDLVLVNVVARDKKGALVPDLKREDFTLLEDNKPQKVSSFDIENTELAAPPEVAGASVEGGPAQAVGEGASKAPTGTNAPATNANLKNRRLIVLFFDFSGMEEEEITRAVEAAQKYLDKQMTAADTVAITSFSSELVVNQDFTADHAALKNALARFTSTSGEGFEA